MDEANELKRATLELDDIVTMLCHFTHLPTWERISLAVNSLVSAQHNLAVALAKLERGTGKSGKEIK